jgi:hypothetical protein
MCVCACVCVYVCGATVDCEYEYVGRHLRAVWGRKKEASASTAIVCKVLYTASCLNLCSRQANLVPAIQGLDARKLGSQCLFDIM